MGRDIGFLLELEEEDHYEPVRIDNAFNNIYIILSLKAAVIEIKR